MSASHQDSGATVAPPMRARHLAAALGAAILAGIAPGTALAGDPIMPLSQLRPGMQCTGYSVIRGTDDQLVRRRDRRRPLGRRVGQRRPADPRPRVRPGGRRDRRRPGLLGLADLLRRRSATRARSPRRSASTAARPCWRRRSRRSSPTRPTRREAKPIARQSRRRARAAAGRAADGLRPERRDRRAAGARGRAARRAGARCSSPPALPLSPFPAAPPRPGSAMGVGYSSGDLAVGAVGTVAYVDGDRVWGFGHPFENSGLRSLLLQDAYVYTVISNPNAGDDTGSTYKLAAVGHDLGTISNDASAAVVGRTGAPAADHPGADLQRGRRHRRARHARRERGRRDRRRHADRRLRAVVRRAARARPGRLGGPAQRARQAHRQRLHPDRACASARSRCGSATATPPRSRRRTRRRAPTSSPPAAPRTRSRRSPSSTTTSRARCTSPSSPPA